MLTWLNGAIKKENYFLNKINTEWIFRIKICNLVLKIMAVNWNGTE